MRPAFMLAALCLCAAPAAAAVDTPLVAFSKAVDGIWSPLPSKPLMAFGGGEIAVGLQGCTSATRIVRFATVQSRLVRVGGEAEPVAILDARPTGERNGFKAWAIATNAGLQAVLLGSIGSAGTKVDVMMSDEGSYVRCHAPEAKPKP